jgi:hypothetical protein
MTTIYATTVANHRRALRALTAEQLRARADRLEATYRRWRSSRRPPERRLLYFAVLGIRAHRLLARECEARR